MAHEDLRPSWGMWRLIATTNASTLRRSSVRVKVAMFAVAMFAVAMFASVRDVVRHVRKRLRLCP